MQSARRPLPRSCEVLFHSSLFAWTSWLLYKEPAQCLPEQLCPPASAHNSVIQSRASCVYTLTQGRAFKQCSAEVSLSKNFTKVKDPVKYFGSHDPQHPLLLIKGAHILRVNDIGTCRWHGTEKIVVWEWDSHLSSAGWKCMYENDPVCFFFTLLLLPICGCFHFLFRLHR